MSTANLAERVARVNDFATDFATATLTILDGATTLVAFTLAGFVDNADGTVTANAVASETNVGAGTANTATLTAGTQTYTLTVGTSGTDVIINDLAYLVGVTSNFTSLVVTQPA